MLDYLAKACITTVEEITGTIAVIWLIHDEQYPLYPTFLGPSPAGGDAGGLPELEAVVDTGVDEAAVC